MNRTSVAVFGLVVIGALIALLVSRGSPGPVDAVETASPADDVATAEAPMAAPATAERTQPSPSAEPPATAPESQAATKAAPAPTEAAARPAREQDSYAPPTPEPPRAAGPIEELKARLQSDPRDSRAHDYEQLIRRTFREKDIPEALLASALCKKSVCRVSLRWAPDRHMGTMEGLTRLVSSFGQQVAFDPAPTPKPSGETDVDVYFARKPEE